VWLTAASFDALLEWFDDLSRRGIRLSSVVVERTATPGAVDARLVLESQ
jgi:type II secretory pathway component PulM